MNPPAQTRRPLSPPKEVQSFTVLHLVLTVICLGAEVLASIGGRSFPYNFPFIYFQGWVDLLCFQIRFTVLHRLAFFSEAPEYGIRFMYPAPVAVLYRCFYTARPHILAFFLLTTMTLTGLLVAVVWRAAVRRGLSPVAGLTILGSAVLLGYPFWFEYMLGNMEICIFLLVAFGVLALVRNHAYTAAALFGMAMSMKIFPLVYFGLLISKRQYRQVAFGILTAVGVTLGSLWVVNPHIGVAWHGVQAGLDQFKNLYMLRYLPVETGFDHSIFGLIKRLDYRRHALAYPLAPILSVYLPVVAIAGIVLYFAVIRRLPQLNQILVLTIASILLPPTSHDYTLLHLYTPWALLLLFSLGAAKAQHRVKGLLTAFLCFAILLAPQSEFIRDGRAFGGQIKCVVLIVLFIVGLLCPFVEEPFGDPSHLDRDEWIAPATAKAAGLPPGSQRVAG